MLKNLPHRKLFGMKCLRIINKYLYCLSYVKEEHRLRVFENRVLRRIFGPKRDEVTGVWRKLHN
jgi:hypothetical protein